MYIRISESEILETPLTTTQYYSTIAQIKASKMTMKVNLQIWTLFIVWLEYLTFNKVYLIN